MGRGGKGTRVIPRSSGGTAPGTTVSGRIVWAARWLVNRLASDEQMVVRMVWSLLRPHWGLLVLAFLASVGAAVLEGSTLALMALALEALFGVAEAGFETALGSVGRLADTLLGNLGPQSAFLALVVLAMTSTIARGALQFGGATASAYLQAEVFKNAWNRLFSRIITMKYAHVSKYKTGDLNQYVWDAHAIYLVLQQLNVLLGNVLVIIVYITVLLWLSWSMTLVAVPVFVVLTVSANRLVGRVRASAEEFLPARVEMGNLSLEFIGGLRLVRVFAREEYAVDRMAAAVDETMRHMRRRSIWLASIHPVMQSAIVIGVAALVVVGYLMFRDVGPAALPRLLTFLFVSYRVFPLVGSLNHQRAVLNDLYPVVRRIANMLNAGEVERPVGGGVPFKGVRHTIEFQDVSLRYVEGEQAAVQNLSFILPRGSMIALVGESGAGKSTVADLLLRLYDPTGGQILIDGVDLRRLDLTQWRGGCGVVSQDTFVFNASIRDNIAFGRLEASESEIIAAARTSNAHDFIMELAGGYDTVVGDRGYRLSGGELQRLAMARAILSDPEILVLDEATSELDSESERQIQQALSEFRAERCVLAIAHRLSTIVMADQILVVADGRLVEQGTHHELLALKGRYYRFWRLQSRSDDSDTTTSGESVGSGNEI